MKHREHRLKSRQTRRQRKKRAKPCDMRRRKVTLGVKELELRLPPGSGRSGSSRERKFKICRFRFNRWIPKSSRSQASPR